VTCSAPALTRHCCCGLCLALLQAADLQLRAALAAAEDAHEQAARKIAWRSAELEEEQGRLDEEEANRRAGWRSTMEGERLEMAERMEADYRERMAVAIKVRKHASMHVNVHSLTRCRGATYSIARLCVATRRNPLWHLLGRPNQQAAAVCRRYRYPYSFYIWQQC
jgi:hypothetical protein